MKDHYPEYHMFGTLPAYGLYARHAKDLTLCNVKFDLGSPDLRPALVCDDVQDLELHSLRAQGSLDAESLIRLHNTSRAFIHGCRPLNAVRTFLRIEGGESRDILLQGNDLRQAERAAESAQGADSSAVVVR